MYISYIFFLVIVSLVGYLLFIAGYLYRLLVQSLMVMPPAHHQPRGVTVCFLVSTVTIKNWVYINSMLKILIRKSL